MMLSAREVLARLEREPRIELFASRISFQVICELEDERGCTVHMDRESAYVSIEKKARPWWQRLLDPRGLYEAASHARAVGNALQQGRG